MFSALFKDWHHRECNIIDFETSNYSFIYDNKYDVNNFNDYRYDVSCRNVDLLICCLVV